MNLGEASSNALVESLLTALPFDRVDVVVAPSFPCLRIVLEAVRGTPLAVAAQNMHWEAGGAFTGEVAPPVLAEMGVRFVIVGHSERRELFGETDETVSRKIVAARRHGLVPIVCVGETEAQREIGTTREAVGAQIRAAFFDRPVASPDDIVVAYEPRWAIGTGRTPDPFEITEAHGAIREALTECCGGASSAIRVLYGGSVTEGNARSILSAPEVDGALVGGASLSASSFASIAVAAGAC